MKNKINFAWPVTAEHAVVYQHFQSQLERIKGLLVNKRIVIFGAGIRGCCLLRILEQQGFKQMVFCDNNTEKQGNVIDDYPIYSFAEILDGPNSQIILVAPENSGTIAEQLRNAGLREEQDWISFDISVYDAYQAEYNRPVLDHMLVIGDCAFSHIALADEVTDSLGDMIKERLNENRCKVLSMHGIGQQANYHILRSLLDKGERPALVFQLIMEALTPKAHLMPRTQHPKLIRSLVEAEPNQRTEFREYATLAEERFNRFQVESFAAFKKGEGDLNEKLYMKMNYLFKIREETEGVVYLKKTIRLLNDAGVPIVLYVPPVNYMQGERFFGTDFKMKYMENFDKLYRFLDAEELKYEVVDASFLLTEAEFAAANTIDETSNFRGRSKLVKFFGESAALREIFK